mmetsp:Transcript_111142/g.354531  ORF Transcript_111142/g.354531 Transcript_111142/m.354531 type:complete len:215 (+) Transcript_111142:309-953(+)
MPGARCPALGAPRGGCPRQGGGLRSEGGRRPVDSALRRASGLRFEPGDLRRHSGSHHKRPSGHFRGAGNLLLRHGRIRHSGAASPSCQLISNGRFIAFGRLPVWLGAVFCSTALRGHLEPVGCRLGRIHLRGLAGPVRGCSKPDRFNLRRGPLGPGRVEPVRCRPRLLVLDRAKHVRGGLPGIKAQSATPQVSPLRRRAAAAPSQQYADRRGAI